MGYIHVHVPENILSYLHQFLKKRFCNNHQLTWVNSVKHIGSYINTTNNDIIDCAKNVNIHWLC